MTRLLEFLARHRSDDAFIQAAVDRLLAFRPLAAHAKGQVGHAVSDDDAQEKDGSPPAGIEDLPTSHKQG